MFTLLREHRYSLQIGADSYLLRVEEVVAGASTWTAKFRVHIPASVRNPAETLYGSAADEVAEKAAKMLSER